MCLLYSHKFDDNQDDADEDGDAHDDEEEVDDDHGGAHDCDEEKSDDDYDGKGR